MKNPVAGQPTSSRAPATGAEQPASAHVAALDGVRGIAIRIVLIDVV